MSVQAISWALEQDTLPSIHKFVLVILCNYANMDGECYPSQSTVARKCSISRQHVNTIIGELEEGGYLRIFPQTRTGGGDRSNIYKLSMPGQTLGKTGVIDEDGFLYIAKTYNKTKVGVSRHIERRIRGMETALGEKIFLLKTYPLRMSRARSLERLAHEKLKPHRLFGEWFSCPPEQVIKIVDAMVVSTTLTPPDNIDDTPVSTTTTPGVYVVDTYVEPSLNRHKEPPLNLPALRAKSDWPSDHESLFWKAYPRRIGRKAAMKALGKVRRSGLVAWPILFAAVEKFAAWAATKEIQYVKHPATWLNAGCWDDELTTGEFENGHRGPRPLQDDSKSISRAADKLAEAARRGEFSFGPRPSLLPSADESSVRLLPKG